MLRRGQCQVKRISCRRVVAGRKAVAAAALLVAVGCRDLPPLPAPAPELELELEPAVVAAVALLAVAVELTEPFVVPERAAVELAMVAPAAVQAFPDEESMVSYEPS